MAVVSSTPPGVELVDEDDADLHLWISNQSFADPAVSLSVEVDGRHVLTGCFEVGTQHGWVLYPLRLPGGDHTLRVTSDTGATLDVRVAVPEGERRYAAVQYQRTPAEPEGRIRWHLDSRPIAFM
jgi:hypothetical protein